MWFNTNEHITNGYNGFENYYPIFKRGIFLDTAPLFILVCGHYDKNNNTFLIEKFNAKTIKNEDREYKKYDYDYLLAFLNSLNQNKVPLFITPHIFTEFIKHLWDIVDNPKQFKDIINHSFKSKSSQIKDKIHDTFCDCFFNEVDFLDKKLEVGDVSILICAKNEKENNGAITILTADITFAEISDKKHNFITIYYPEIRTATYQLGSKNIPESYLKE